MGFAQFRIVIRSDKGVIKELKKKQGALEVEEDSDKEDEPEAGPLKKRKVAVNKRKVVVKEKCENGRKLQQRRPRWQKQSPSCVPAMNFSLTLTLMIMNRPLLCSVLLHDCPIKVDS